MAEDKSTVTEPSTPPIYPPAAVSRQTVTINGKPLAYDAIAEAMPIPGGKVEPEAYIFYTAYTLADSKRGSIRPLTFVFNGGPGSSSVWLHLGAIGPRVVKLLDDGNLPPAPYKMEGNSATWLAFTDLVFIDPVGTGYSRAHKAEDAKNYWNMEGDFNSISEFIRIYLSRNNRWLSPVYLAGESYGTMRAAGIASKLIEKGVALNGISLISTVLSFQTLIFCPMNDLPFALFLPTYTATAWYHNKLGAGLQSNLAAALKKSEEFALGEYWSALALGSRLGENARQSIAKKLADLTGLSKEYVLQSNLRIEIHQFCKHLLRDSGETVGRLDSRIKGFDKNTVAAEPDFDPSMSTIRPPFTSVYNQYVRQELGFATDMEYFILGGGFTEKWDWGNLGDGMPDTSDALRDTFAKNPHMKVFVASGLYDLATPYLAARYTFDHLGVPAKIHDQIVFKDYPSGHMMYILKECLPKLTSDVREFYAPIGAAK